MTFTFVLLQILLLSATGLAARPAHFRRQFETCSVSCGDGWCCLEFESCVKDPANTDAGGWSCIIQGVSNDDGSPITDAPFNPSSDAAVFNSIDSFVASQSQFLSSLTSELKISTLTPTITAVPSPTFSQGPTLTAATTSTSATASTSASLSVSSSGKSTVSTSGNTTKATTSAVPSTFVQTSGGISIRITNRNWIMCLAAVISVLAFN